MNTIQPDIPVMELNSILVPVDFSESASHAVRYAVAFAKNCRARITLLHVLYLHYMAGEFGPVDLPVVEAQMKDMVRNKLDALAREHVPPSLLAGVAVANGPVVHEIATYAKAQNIDLIVIATHGHTGLKRFMLGSVAENVVRHAPCPVLVVREREHEFIHEQPA